MSAADEVHDDLDIGPSKADPHELKSKQQHRRLSESEVTEELGGLGFKRQTYSPAAQDLAMNTPPWREAASQSDAFGSSGSNAPLFRSRSITASGGLFGTGARRRFGSISSPPTRQASTQGPRYGRQGWKTNDSSAAVEDDDRPKLVSLSDLIRKEDKVPATLYDHGGDTDVVIDTRDVGGGGLPQQAMNGGTVGIQDALQAAEHGNSILLSKFLQDGGDVATVSRLHHMRWSLLHLAAGCAMMGGRLSFANYRRRPEPDCNDGYATCVSELLAAGADPNVTSKQRGYTPLMSAALTGSKECCWLLLRAGAQVDRKAEDGRTAFDFAQKAKQVGGGSVGGRGSVMAVLRDPPKKVPRSPTSVKATLAELRCLEPEDAVPAVEVRWRVPSQASLLPSICGDVERYYIKCWCRGKGKEVMPTTTTVDVPRRDFCRNQIIDRGIALRKNLCLPQSTTASAIVHGLQAGEYYSFTVSCVAEVEGALRHSPPSCISKPLFIPESKEDHQWHLGGMLSMVTGNNVPSPGGAAAEGGVSQAQARRGQEQAVTDDEHRRGQLNPRGVTWAKDDHAGASGSAQQAEGSRVTGDADASLTGYVRSLPTAAKNWDSRGDFNDSPVRPRSASHASPTSRATDETGSMSRLPSSRALLDGQTSAPFSASPLNETGQHRQQIDLQMEGRHSFRGTPTASSAPRTSREHHLGGERESAVAMSTRRTDHGLYRDSRQQSFQDEGCTLT